MRRGAWEKEIYGGDSVDEDNNGGGDGGDDNDDDDGEARPGSRREHRMRTGGRISQRDKRPEKISSGQ